MDLTYLHLILNHLPVLGVMFGLLVLAWGLLRGYEEVKTVGLVVLVLTALIVIPVYLTGEPAEESVENLPGVSESLIELHEDSALISLLLAIITGVAALAAIILRRFVSYGIGQYSILATLLLSLGTSVLLARTANLGGEIRHSEIRQAAQNEKRDNEARKPERGDDDH